MIMTSVKKEKTLVEGVKRELYVTSEGIEVNADVNGALNILSKSNSNNNKISYLRSRGITIPKRIQVCL